MMFARVHRSLTRIVWSLGLLLLSVPGWAQPDELPGRVGRLSEVHGRVWLYDLAQGQWVEGTRNQALASGDRLSIERGARAEVRIGSTELRLDGDTELEFDRIDDDRMVFRLDNGSLALRVRSSSLAREVEVRSGELRILPARAGQYRVDREDEVTYAAAWRGELRVDTRDQQVRVVAGRRAEFFRDPRDSATAVSWSSPVSDEFWDWVVRDERRDERDRAASPRYVSPEMTGAEDLDRYGRWERHPEYGMVWFPLQVAVDWAPYRYGHWSWHVLWGWTWIDDAPWGFAPSHYGRWVHWGGRWCWSPGVYDARPAFAPALVAWIGGPQVSFSVTIGGRSAPAVGWIPLAPRDVYVPPYRYTPRYYERVNRPQRPYHPPQVPTGPIMYGNRGVPDAVTVVPSDVLRQRQPVAPAVVHDRDVQRAIARERFRHDTPEAVRIETPRVVAVPGGAEPARIPAPPGRETRPPSRVIDLRRERAVVPAQEAGPRQAPAPTPHERPAPAHRPAPAPAVGERPVPGPGAAPSPAERPGPRQRPAPAPAVTERPGPPQRPEAAAPPMPRPVGPQRPEAAAPPMPRPVGPQRPATAPQPAERSAPTQRSGAAPADRPAPPVVAPAARPAPPASPREVREPRRERDDDRGRDERQPRTPESRQNQRDRQNQQ